MNNEPEESTVYSDVKIGSAAGRAEYNILCTKGKVALGSVLPAAVYFFKEQLNNKESPTSAMDEHNNTPKV